ncbi:hypothetical protein CRYPA_1411 [uncultured Candidatus Thioglobus sp.]|nr:hypothetical protein CRYPA_1411 [uncultured Candidatus Thioglobus sp.]
MNSLAIRIKKFRQLRGLSQKELARKIGVTSSAISQYESSSSFNSEPSVKNLRKISQEFNISFEWLATGRGLQNIEEYLIDVTDIYENKGDLVLLTKEQKKLLELYEKHPKDWQKKYLAMLDATAKICH